MSEKTDQQTQPGDLAGFEATYRAHVAMVHAGDMSGVMADMLPSSLPDVFVGVDVPRGAVTSAEVRSVRLDEEGTSPLRAVGEAVYRTEAGPIGLRSGWVHDGSSWKADRLDNFEVTS